MATKIFSGVGLSVLAFVSGLALFLNAAPLPADGKGTLGQVTGVEVTATFPHKARVQWDDQFTGLTDTETTIYRYKVRLLNPDGEVLRTVTTRDNEHLFENLKENTAYRVEVRATMIYRKPWSDLVKFRTEPAA
jgi:hypothetical protein